jgi:hypothetical protein
VVVVVTHRYVILTIMLRRMPTFFDTLIPYTLGLGEIGAAQLVGTIMAWWASILFFALSAIGVYAHSRIRTKPAVFGSSTPPLYPVSPHNLAGNLLALIARVRQPFDDSTLSLRSKN